MTSARTDQATATIPDREAIRAELEATRRAYHELVKSISPDEWRKKSPIRAGESGRFYGTSRGAQATSREAWRSAARARPRTRPHGS